MKYLSVNEIAKKWGVSERSVRNYCTKGRVDGAFLTGKTWNIPENTPKPDRTHGTKASTRTLPEVLREEMHGGISGGIYHKVQIELTYNSNHIEGSRLTHEQTRYIFETNTIGSDSAVNVNDVVETANHFNCVDAIIEQANRKLTEKFIKELHRTLKNGTSDSRLSWFNVGEYKKLPNEAGGRETTAPEDVPAAMSALIENYNSLEKPAFDDVLDFHYRFERIHPFQDGNGRVGRLILFKECLRCGFVPFIIDEELKMFYYRGLSEWQNVRGYLRDTCLTAQDKFKLYLDYFKIDY